MTHDLNISAKMNTSHRLVRLCSMVDTFPAFAKLITFRPSRSFQRQSEAARRFFDRKTAINPKEPPISDSVDLSKPDLGLVFSPKGPTSRHQSQSHESQPEENVVVFEPALLWICCRLVNGLMPSHCGVNGFWLCMLKPRSRRVFAQCNHVIHLMTYRRSKIRCFLFNLKRPTFKKCNVEDLGEILKIPRGLESTPSIFFVDFGLLVGTPNKNNTWFSQQPICRPFFIHQNTTKAEAKHRLRSTYETWKETRQWTCQQKIHWKSTWKPTFLLFQFWDDFLRFFWFSQLWVSAGSSAESHWVSPRHVEKASQVHRCSLERSTGRWKPTIFGKGIP